MTFDPSFNLQFLKKNPGVKAQGGVAYMTNMVDAFIMKVIIYDKIKSDCFPFTTHNYLQTIFTAITEMKFLYGSNYIRELYTTTYLSDISFYSGNQ